MIKLGFAGVSLCILAACGGGAVTGTGGGSTPTTPTTPTTPGTSGAPSYSSGGLTKVVLESSFGGAVQGTATVNGTDMPLIAAGIPNTLFDGTRYYATASNGDQLAVVRYSPSGVLSAEYLEGQSGAPTAGNATLTGNYHGTLFGPYSGAYDPVNGDVSITADFASGQIDGAITNRTRSGKNGYDETRLRSDLTFSGNMTAEGLYRGPISNTNSNGNVNTIVNDTGAVGSIVVNHAGAFLNATPNSSIREIGTFSAD